jgi:hypothetical protein
MEASIQRKISDAGQVDFDGSSEGKEEEPCIGRLVDKIDQRLLIFGKQQLLL